jgi:hypothetical protein
LLPVERSYWSQRWIDVADLLRSTANRLRQQRAVRQIETDSGWWEDRDLTITNRTWFRVDVRAMIEEHGGGSCLYRLAVRPRLTAAVALPLLAALGTTAVLKYSGMSWSASAAIVGVLTLTVALACVLRTSVLVLKALSAMAADVGLTSIPRHQLRSDGNGAEATPLQPAGLTLTTRTLTEDSGASSALVSDV